MSPQPPVPSGRWRFGQFELDVSTRELRKNGLRIRLQEQSARILEALLARPGELVTREELRERLWPADTFVDFERSLNAAISKLRQVLADSAEQPRYVETVARRGYRFVAPVEASLATQETAALPSFSIGEADGSVVQPKRGKWGWAVAGVFLLALASVGIFRLSSRALSRQPPAVRFVVLPPEGTRIHPTSAISPDGSQLAFVVVDSSGRRTLWLRPLAAEAAIRFENTDEAVMPFFSPDSRHIGFFAGGKLKRIPTSGGSPQIVCEVNQPAGGTWNRDNVILFSQSGRLYRVPAGGGAATELARPATAGENNIDTWPEFLPDGRRFIVSTATHNGHINALRSEILLGSINSSERKWLVSARSRGAITPSGHLLFKGYDDALVAQKLDLSRNRLVGEPLAVAQNLNRSSGGIYVDVKAGLPVAVMPAQFSASDNGVLVYHSGPPLTRQLVWFNREGKRLGTAGEPREYMQIVLSPDEQWAALGVRSRGSWNHWNIWLLHLGTNVLSPLSFGEGRDADPTWGPHSDRIVYGAYQAERGENVDLMEVKLGEHAAKRIYADGNSNKPEAWSPDGHLLLFRRNEETVLSLPTSGDRKPAVLLDTAHINQAWRFSPDGRWLAYSSLESGRAQIYVSRFPGMTGTRQVSIGSGCAPVWRKDGKELFYMTELGQLMSVEVKAGSSMETRAPKQLFQVEITSPNMPQFGVIDNGQKFLVIESPRLRPGDERMVVITNWNASLRQ